MKSLAAALLAFQADTPPIHKDATNPHFRNKYVSLDSLVTSVLPALNKHGLVLTQAPTFVSGMEGPLPALTTRVIHAESGELLEDTMLLRDAKADPQGQGSALTYARRYALLSVLGLVADEDDDGTAATGLPAKREPSKPAVKPKAQTAPAFQAPETARAAVAADEAKRAKPADAKKLVALAAKMIGEGKIKESHLDRSSIDEFGFSFKAAMADPNVASAYVEHFLGKLERYDKSTEKAQQEVAA